MDELKWKWVYIPYLDAPEKQKESALKAGYIKVVNKSEADKEIAYLEESHKMEVEQLLMEIVELKKACNDNLNWCLRTLKENRHSNYKRCLAMAGWCGYALRLMRTYEVTEDFWNLEPGQDAEYYCKKGDFYRKWRKRWLELAEEPTWAKFLQLIHKEAK